MHKKEYVQQVANTLKSQKATMKGSELVDALNANNYKTDEGTKYKKGRGVFVLINATRNWLNKQGKKQDAQNVSLAFTNENGKYPYDK